MIIEIINGALWFAIVYHFYQLNPWPQNLLMFWLNTVAYLVFTSALLAALAIDLESYIIPDELNNFALFTGITLDLVGIVARDPMHTPLWGWLPRSIAGAVVCAGIFVFIQLFGLLLFRKDAMGDGDVKLARAIGAMLPLGLAVTSFVLAIALGAVIGGSLIAVSGFLPKRPEKKAVNNSDQLESESILEVSSDRLAPEEGAEVGVEARAD
jgi:leader peptidase (prepilin peptidase)/N-methyltransferase